MTLKMLSSENRRSRRILLLKKERIGTLKQKEIKTKKKQTNKNLQLMSL